MELVFSIGSVPTWSTFDRYWYAWDEAQMEAELAYEAWCHEPGTQGYVVYRAAQDRADAAQDALARCSGSAITTAPPADGEWGSKPPRPVARSAERPRP
jgi:hypothetical protein